jgi:exosortase/archaeosortase family protein
VHDLYDIMAWPYLGLVASLVMAAILGIVAYLITSRRGNHSALSFLTRYGAWFFALFFLEWFVVAFLPGLASTLRGAMAKLVGDMFTMANVPHTVSGSTIFLQSPYLAFDVTQSCLGGILLWAYAGLVLAEPRASTKQKIVGILVGFAILLAFNFLRIVLSIYLEWLDGARVHDYFYLFNIVFVILVWAGWLWTTKSRMTLKNA